MKNIRHMILGAAVVGLCFNVPLLAKGKIKPKPVVTDSLKAETSLEKKERAFQAISFIVNQRNELRKELAALKAKLSEVLHDGQGDVLSKINELGQLKAKLQQLELNQGMQTSVVEQMDSVIQKIKEHDILIDIIATKIPDDIILEEKTGVPEKDVQLRMQLFEAKYGAIGKERDRLKKNIDSKDQLLKSIRLERDELRHYLIELVNYADANKS